MKERWYYHQIRRSLSELHLHLSDKNGNRYTYEIMKLIPDPRISDNFFSFDEKKYPGVEVVDLR